MIYGCRVKENFIEYFSSDFKLEDGNHSDSMRTLHMTLPLLKAFPYQTVVSDC
jgi:hypothetical protein